MFRQDEIVYCIDNHYTYGNTRSSSLIKLNLHTPYTIVNPDGGNGDVLLKEIKDIYYNSKRFVSEMDYITSIRKDKIENIKRLIKTKIRYKKWGIPM